ncbi:uncharacterized protein LOC121660450 [Corvus kubaryi]|uniref:uncharacterized protein LOC121660450 n=1 Tax=Corvus kubaryi TaxID=68294 RepID=UPI001C04DA6B|nr:uncharacterized protein LOC121660450 [Corvus kubaryi]
MQIQVQIHIWMQVNVQFQDQVQFLIQIQVQMQTQVQFQDQDQVQDQIHNWIQIQVKVQIQDQIQVKVQFQNQVQDQIQVQFQNQFQDQIQIQVQVQVKVQDQIQVQVQVPRGWRSPPRLGCVPCEGIPKLPPQFPPPGARECSHQGVSSSSFSKKHPTPLDSTDSWGSRGAHPDSLGSLPAPGSRFSFLVLQLRLPVASIRALGCSELP